MSECDAYSSRGRPLRSSRRGAVLQRARGTLRFASNIIVAAPTKLIELLLLHLGFWIHQKHMLRRVLDAAVRVHLLVDMMLLSGSKRRASIASHSSTKGVILSGITKSVVLSAITHETFRFQLDIKSICPNRHAAVERHERGQVQPRMQRRSARCVPDQGRRMMEYALTCLI